MTLSVTPQASPLATNLVQDDAATNVIQKNVLGGAGVMRLIEVDNTPNPAAPVYLKIWDNINPTLGTDAPDYTLRIPQNVKRSLGIPEGFAVNALSFAVLANPDDSDTTAPGSAVIVRMLTS